MAALANQTNQTDDDDGKVEPEHKSKAAEIILTDFCK